MEESATPEVNPQRSIPERSVETQIIVDLIAGMEVGHTISYEELAKAINEKEVKAGTLHSARNIAERDNKAFTACVRGVGIKRINDEQVVEHEHTDRRRRISRQARVSAKRIGRVDYDALTDHGKVKHQTAATTAAMVTMTLRPKQQEKIKKLVSEGKPPSLAEVCEHFAKK